MFDNAWLWAGAAAALGLLGTLWSYLRVAYQQVVGRLIVTVTVQGYQSEAVQVYLRNRFSASSFGPRSYIGWLLHVRPKRRTQLVAMEVIGSGGRLFWQRWRPLWVSKANGNDAPNDSGVTSRDYESNGLSITFLRGMFSADQLMVAATDYYNQQMVALDESGNPSNLQSSRFTVRFIHGSAGKQVMSRQSHRRSNVPSSASDIQACLAHRPLGWHFDQLGGNSEGEEKAIEQLVLSPEAETMVREARFWCQNEQWYRDRQIPWKRGWLLYGQPGTGKTALTRAIAHDMDLPIFVFDIASLTNEEMQTEWSKMLVETPCFAVIEDVDAVFHGRENVATKEGAGLTFDCLLNCLDGLQRCHGLLAVITTNHLDKVDPALGRPMGEHDSTTRPGRIDRAICLGPLSLSGRRKIAARILDHSPELQATVVAAGDGETAAQFQERCARLALSRLWENAVPNSKPDDDAPPKPYHLDPCAPESSALETCALDPGNVNPPSAEILQDANFG